MSHWYFTDKVPARYRGMISVRDEEGFFYRNIKVAGPWDSSETIRQAMDRILEDERQQENQRKLEAFLYEGNRIIKDKQAELMSQLKSLQASQKNFDARSQRLIETADNLQSNVLVDAIVASYRVKVKNSVAAARQNIIKLEGRIGANSTSLTTLNETLNNTADGDKAEILVQQIRKIPAFEHNGSRLDINRDFDALETGLAQLGDLINKVNSVVMALQKVDSNLATPLMLGLKDRLAEANPEDPLSFVKVAESVGTILRQLEQELIDRQVNHRQDEREKDIGTALARVKEAVTAVALAPQVTVNYCEDLLKSIHEQLNQLTSMHIGSASIADRVAAIGVYLSSLQAVSTQRDASALSALHFEMDQLKKKNDEYNSQEAEFNKHYEELSKTAKDAGTLDRLPAMTFNPATYQDDLAKMKQLNNEFFRDKIKHLYAQLYRESVARMKAVGFQELTSECVGVHSCEIPGDESSRYTKLVYFHKDSPMVATVVYILPNGQSSIESCPVLLHLNGHYYYLKPNEGTLQEVHKNCARLHDQSKGGAYEEASLDDLAYLALSDEGSIAYARANGLLDEGGHVQNSGNLVQAETSQGLRKATSAKLRERSNA
jgi:hypothetical protein